jgi:hypothetical protein
MEMRILYSLENPLPCSQRNSFVYWRPGQKRLWWVGRFLISRNGVARQSSLLVQQEQFGPESPSQAEVRIAR